MILTETATPGGWTGWWSSDSVTTCTEGAHSACGPDPWSTVQIKQQHNLM